MEKQHETIGSFEAKTHFSRLIEQVENGEVEEFIITKYGKAVARLIPADCRGTASINEAIEGLKRLSEKQSLGEVDWKELRDEGRRTHGF
ncbi:MAG: type II toxin-antitoxin system prevent-host-death family antitoxin [Candidatus Caenarcaniphilales bacterium]|nr:type II toxin-antitoxin system prevent-host-death family antitoxin [Candidatus Caenarcaniphilales bacterium]